MGTNYYLHQKANYKRARKLVGENDYTPYEESLDFGEEKLKVQELDNGGYVFNNKYYPTLEELNKDYFLKFHIGKSSYGWRFLLQTYPHIKSLDDWKALFNLEGSKIFDEYGDEISKEELLEEITHKKPVRDLTEKEKEFLDGTIYEVRDGLIVHPLKYGIIDNSQKETYDIHNEGLFS